MEHIENKLNTIDPVLVSQVFSRLIESIRIKSNKKQEYSYLKSKCLCDNNLIGDVARISLGTLIESGVFPIDQVLADFVTSISTASNISALAKTITNVLYLQLSRQRTDKDQAKIRPYRLLDHPIIKILQGDSSCDLQLSIYKEVVQSYKDLSLSSAINILYGPLYLYSICNPTIKPEQTILRQKFWSFLIEYDENNGTSYIFKLCCWLQIQNKNAELAAFFLNELFQRQLNCEEPLKNLDQLILVQILVIHNMILNHVDCRLAIKTTIRILEKSAIYSHNNVAILVLSKALMVCSPLYLEDLLQLCFLLASHKVCQPHSFLALKSTLLHWLAGPCPLTESALKIAENILKLNDQVCRERPLIFVSRLSIDRLHYLMFCNPELFLALHLCIKVDFARESEVSAVLDRFGEAPMHYWKNCFNFLCGLLLHKKLGAEDKLKVLAILVKCATHYLEYLPTLLTLVLYELSNTEDNKLHFELVKTLPLMARVKENVPKVVATIQAISKQSSTLGNLALRLMYDTWEIENKCYSALETIVLQTPVSRDDWFETNIAKAYIFKQLSEKRPELYGKDLVAHLSKVLNECATSEGSIACALALEGIIYLCRAEVIDIVTTWATLAPKFKNDTRAPVIKRLCGLISEIPQLEYAQSYEKLQDEVAGLLWNYIVTSDNEEIVNAALGALAAFPLDLICVHMPDMYLVDSSVIKQQGDVDHLRVLPGKVWLKFLSTHKFREAARNFLVQLVDIEIKTYLKYVYQLKARREPNNYGALPTHSIVRALGEHLKNNFAKVIELQGSSNENVFVDCLQILSLKHPKPLPPLDWCFLQELIHIPAVKGFCLDLASRQAILSGSARRLMENYIVAMSESPSLEDAAHVYRNLKYLANSIQPMVLKPFLKNSLYLALEVMEQNSFFKNAVGYLQEVLEDNEIQDVNKNVIEDILTEMVSVTDVSSQAFPLFLSSLATFSQSGLVKITKFDSENFSEENFIKIIKIRCHVAKQTQSANPLVWLKDIFEVAFKNNIETHLYFEDLTSVLLINVNHEESPNWLNELFGEIQAKVADRCDSAEIAYFCDILALAVLYFSGLFVILPNYGYDSIKYFFPAALTFLLDEPMWSIYTTQIIEWLHHMNGAECVPDEFQHIFGWALSSLRHDEEFCKNFRWMKYLDCQIYTENIF